MHGNAAARFCDSAHCARSVARVYGTATLIEHEGMRFLPSLGFVVVAPAILVALSGGCGGPPVAPPPGPPAPKLTPPKPVAAVPSRLSAPEVDRAIRAAWTAAGVTPAKPADDATWLRRVTFDIVGAPPSPEDVLAFVADKSPDKRAKKVDALLASPLYATHWTNVWDDILVGHDVRDPRLDRAELRAWLHGRFSANAPWDKMVAELVSATGQNSEGGTRNALPMDVPTPDAPNGMAGMNGMGGTSGVTSDAPTAASGAQGVNGAVNYTLRFQTPQDLAGSASRTFLGVQIQCAQCHDHKTEKWKQDDFRKLTAAFLHAEIEPIDKGQTKGIRRVIVSDTARVQARSAKNAELAPIAAATPTALDGTVLDKGKETRKELATWMTSPKNPWFAKAYVNRIWAHFVGRGFVNPVDDLRVGNPTTLPETLEAMAKDFAENGFDTKALIRLVCASEVYGLDARGEENIAPENVTWAR